VVANRRARLRHIRRAVLRPGGFVAGSRTFAGPIAGPSWSPDGRRLAYVGDYGCRRPSDHVFVVDRDGRHRKPLVAGSGLSGRQTDRGSAYRTLSGNASTLSAPTGSATVGSSRSRPTRRRSSGRLAARALQSARPSSRSRPGRSAASTSTSDTSTTPGTTRARVGHLTGARWCTPPMCSRSSMPTVPTFTRSTRVRSFSARPDRPCAGSAAAGAELIEVSELPSTDHELAVAHEYDTADRDLEQIGLQVGAASARGRGCVWRLTLPRGEPVQVWTSGTEDLRSRSRSDG